jgi:hypothetical protein
MTASGFNPYTAVGRFVGLDHGVGYLRGLSARQKSLSTRERRTPPSCCVATCGRRGDPSRHSLKINGVDQVRTSSESTNSFRQVKAGAGP